MNHNILRALAWLMLGLGIGLSTLVYLLMDSSGWLSWLGYFVVAFPFVYGWAIIEREAIRENKKRRRK